MIDEKSIAKLVHKECRQSNKPCAGLISDRGSSLPG